MIMAPSIKVNGYKNYVTALECRYGRMEQNMRAAGRTIRLRGVAFSGMRMAMSLMESGKRTRLTDSAHILISMEQSMKANGCKTSSMGRGERYGKMEAAMRACILRA